MQTAHALMRNQENCNNIACGMENILSKQACDELEKLKVHIQKVSWKR